MSKSNYEKCHVSYRGRMNREIDAAREVLQKHKKPCAAAVKELHDKTDMLMSECCNMLRCLWRDAKLKCLEVENVRLRELCKRFTEYVSQDRCEGCVVKSLCRDGEVDECWQITEIRELARELGIEVPE